MADKSIEISLSGVRLDGLSLLISPTLTFEDWEKMGRLLYAESRRAEERNTQVNWWIGDWWAYGNGADEASGKPRYGLRAKAAAEGIFGKAFGTLVNLGTVARAFESPRRRGLLSFTHHVEVAALAKPDADMLLEKAEEQLFSTRELRKEILRHRLASGDFSFQREEDVEHDQTVAIARDWNRAVYPARRTILDLLEEAGAIKILTDTAEQVELDP